MTDHHFIDEVKAVSQLTDKDQALLDEMQPAIERQAQNIVDAFYAHLETFEKLHTILHAKPGRVERLKGHLKKWLVGLGAGSYGGDYFEERYRIGRTHVEVGLEPRYVIAAMAFCRGKAAEMIVAAEYAADPQKEARIVALNRVMDVDLNIMLQSYDDHRVKQFLEVTGFSEELFETLMAGE